MANELFDSLLFDNNLFDIGIIQTAQDLALSQGFVNVVYFVEFQFKSATTYLSTANFNIDWGGHTWLGFGQVGAISDVQQTESMETSNVTFTLNIAQLEWLAIALGDIEEYRGRAAKLYMCPLTSNYQLIDTPVLLWKGYMDTMGAGISGEEGSISLKCESSAYGLKRLPTYRLNAAQWSKYHPNDKGMEYIEALIAEDFKWLTKRFQQI